MFRDEHGFTYMPTKQEVIYNRKLYNQAQAELEDRIAHERRQLDAWLSDKKNRSISYYFLVEEIFNSFHRESCILPDGLESYRNRLEDMKAVNEAISGMGVVNLQARADASMANHSSTLEMSGLLMGLLAVTLLLVGVGMLNPLVIYLGAMTGLTAFGIYNAGIEKVSTEKSRLFRALDEKVISVSPSKSCELAR